MTIQNQRVSTLVFISSTSEDLKPYREAAGRAAVAAKLQPEMMEYFAAGNNPPLPACLEKVSQTDLVVAIVAHRYGWVPPDQADGGHKSITWLECERAAAEGKEVLALLVKPDQPWPEELKEEFRLTAALRGGTATPELFQTVQRNVLALRDFKNWLNSRGLCVFFHSPEDLQAKVMASLLEWRTRRPEWKAPGSPLPVQVADPSIYLQDLLAQTAFIDVRGLQVGTGKAYRFPIDELYISLTTTLVRGEQQRTLAGQKRAGAESALGAEDMERQSRDVSLEQALQERRLVLIGDPGSGKSTFLRRVACALCQTRLAQVPDAAEVRLGLKGAPLPVLVRVADLAEHIGHSRQSQSAAKPSRGKAAGWLTHYLAAAGADARWGLGESFFQTQLESGQAIVLLDGLDEAPDRVTRESLSRTIEAFAAAFPQCPIVVTSRPAAYVEQAVLSDFAHARIEPLGEAAIENFLARWCQFLYADSPTEAEQHRRELVDSLRAVPEIRRMARNPVMLTALAVVHWNERRLPEQRADLYESVITWLSRSREQKANRPPADRAVALLQELALAMQTHADGRQLQVSRRAAAEAIAPELDPAGVTRHTIERAERFLDEEALDSGIIVGRGNDVRFWHLTFQEYLAARAIGGRPDEEQLTMLLDKPRRLYRPEWREVVLLLAGVLHQQGRQKVDRFFSAVLVDAGKRKKLADQAACAGLLGAMVRDLAPLKYEPTDARYHKLLDDVLAIFDAQRGAAVPLRERIEAADALGRAGDPRLDPAHPERWRKIKADTFWMGAQSGDPAGKNYDKEASNPEGPVHPVLLADYHIARFPVTVAEYRKFVEHDGYQDKKWWTAGGFGKFDKPANWEPQLEFPSRPVVAVCWFEAMAYAAWSGTKLPTEAQWEYAARGRDSGKFPWRADDADETRLNCYDIQKLGHPTPVGLFPAGAAPCGALDMAGNVWEWCYDWYAEYQASENAVENPSGPADGKHRVLRGGSWLNYRDDARAAIRFRFHPEFRDDFVGFRVVG